MFNHRVVKIRGKILSIYRNEFTRTRYTGLKNELNSAYPLSEFAKRLVKYFKEQYDIEVRKIQTDNGFEFTNRLRWNAFNKDKKSGWKNSGKAYTVIKLYTINQNGRIKRSNRKEQETFYYKGVCYNLKDLSNRGKYWRKGYNNFSMRPLRWLDHKEFLKNIKVYKSQENWL